MSKVSKIFSKAYADSTGTKHLGPPSSSSQGPRPLTTPANLKNVNKATDIYEPWMEPTWHGPEMRPEPKVAVHAPDSPPPEHPELKSRSRFKYSSEYSHPVAEEEAKKMREQEAQKELASMQTADAAKNRAASAMPANPRNKVKTNTTVIPMEPREETKKEHSEYIEHESNAIALPRKPKSAVIANPKNKTLPKAAPMERRHDPEPDFVDEATAMRSLTPPPKKPPVIGKPKNKAKAKAAPMDHRHDPEPEFRSPTPPRTPTPPPKLKSTHKANPLNKPANRAASMDVQEGPIIEPPPTPPPLTPIPRPLNKPRSAILPKKTDVLEGKEEPDVPQRKKAKKKKKPKIEQKPPIEEAREITPTKAPAPFRPPPPKTPQPPPPKKTVPESDSDESDYGPYHRWVMNGRDDDILPKQAHRLLFENKVKKNSRSSQA